MIMKLSCFVGGRPRTCVWFFFVVLVLVEARPKGKGTTSTSKEVLVYCGAEVLDNKTAKCCDPENSLSGPACCGFTPYFPGTEECLDPLLEIIVDREFCPILNGAANSAAGCKKDNEILVCLRKNNGDMKVKSAKKSSKQNANSDSDADFPPAEYEQKCVKDSLVKEFSVGDSIDGGKNILSDCGCCTESERQNIILDLLLEGTKLKTDKKGIRDSGLQCLDRSLLSLSPPPSQPSQIPSSQPSQIPSSLPSSRPSQVPSQVPSSVPSMVPSESPSQVPSSLPSMVPSGIPSQFPSSVPSVVPSESPSQVPSSLPSMVPSGSPSQIPSSFPSNRPSQGPSGRPSQFPSTLPSRQPSQVPSNLPSFTPSDRPSQVPSSQPSQVPSNMPSPTPVTCFTGTAADVTTRCQTLPVAGDRQCCTSSDPNAFSPACTSSSNAGIGNQITVCEGACRGDFACDGLGLNAKIGARSCVGDSACFALGSSASAVEVGEDSCVGGSNACSSLGSGVFGSGSVLIGSGACTGGTNPNNPLAFAIVGAAGYACASLGSSLASAVTIADGSCVFSSVEPSTCAYEDAQFFQNPISCSLGNFCA